ncbi:hypothetical protein BD770DRAFT_208031 [Pilaira anomala]|nr:hypothetical protein BD770DRAFT_208031 [Pilaira anomala]
MIQGDREMSPSNESSCCGSSTSDENDESDDSISGHSSSTPFSPHETPSDLLMLDENVHLFDFGLDLATASSNNTNQQTTTSSYEEVIMMATHKKKPDFSLSLKKKEVVSDNESVVTEEEEDEEEEFKAPVKYTPKKKSFSVHPLCLGKKDKVLTEPTETEEGSDNSLNAAAAAAVTATTTTTTTISPRPTNTPTIYQKLTKASIDWCRYCGTTEGVNWRPGPWGKRTLCNKHGCDYKGYGFACKLPRLDLTGFTRESIDDRDRPVLQLYCSGCQRKESWESNVLVRCEGCPKAFHQKCCPTELSDAFVESKEAWFCDANCCENTRRKRIVVELPRKRLPLMCAPKSNSSSSASSVSSESSTISRARTLREPSISSSSTTTTTTTTTR